MKGIQTVELWSDFHALTGEVSAGVSSDERVTDSTEGLGDSDDDRLKV